jgi:hypothetical protein
MAGKPWLNSRYGQRCVPLHNVQTDSASTQIRIHSTLPSAKVKYISILYIFPFSCTLLSTGRVLPVVSCMQLHFIHEDHHVNRNIFREGSDKMPVLPLALSVHIYGFHC